MTTRAAKVPAINPAVRQFAEIGLGVLFQGYLKTHVTGTEFVPPEGTGTVVAANHVSDLDVFAAGYAVKRQGYFLAKAEATKIPLFGRFLRSLGAIPAQRDGRDMAALKLMVAVLEAGHLLGVAPEGTRSPDGTLKDYDPGFVWLAARTGASIVPCAIHGTWQLMPKGAGYPRRGPIWIRFAPPMVVEHSRASREQLAPVAAEIRATTLGMLGDLADESGIPNPATTAAA